MPIAATFCFAHPGTEASLELRNNTQLSLGIILPQKSCCGELSSEYSTREPEPKQKAVTLRTQAIETYQCNARKFAISSHTTTSFSTLLSKAGSKLFPKHMEIAGPHNQPHSCSSNAFTHLRGALPRPQALPSTGCHSPGTLQYPATPSSVEYRQGRRGQLPLPSTPLTHGHLK